MANFANCKYLQFPLFDADEPEGYNEGLLTYANIRRNNITTGNPVLTDYKYLLCTSCTTSYVFATPPNATEYPAGPASTASMTFKNGG